MVFRDNFIQSVANMENALTNALNRSLENAATSNDLERLLKLIIKKEIVLEFLLEEFPSCIVQTRTFSNTTPILIPEGQPQTTAGPAEPYPSPIQVSGLTGAIQKVTVIFHSLSHTFPEDISAMLVGPNGQDTILMSSAGSGIDIENVTITFDDDATDQLPENDQIISEVYQPTNYGVFAPFPPPANQPSGNTNLSSYNGTDPNGTWNLYIIDQFPVDVGTMAGGWTLSITSCEAESSSTDVDIINRNQSVFIQREKGQEPIVKEITAEEKAKKQEKFEMIKQLKEKL